MEVAAFVVSLFAIGIAFTSLRLAVRADRRADRAEQRDERRLQREEAEAAGRRREKPIVVPKGGTTTDRVVIRNYMVRNDGQGTITGLWLWIIDGEGASVSTRAGGEAVVLAPGDSPVHMTVEVRRPLPVEQELMVEWRDTDGSHVESTGIRPPAHL
jgi:hypothetical protein